MAARKLKPGYYEIKPEYSYQKKTNRKKSHDWLKTILFIIAAFIVLGYLKSRGLIIYF